MGDFDQTIEESSLGSGMAENFGVMIRTFRLIPVDWDAKVEQLKETLPENIPASLPEGIPNVIPDLLPNFNPPNLLGSNQ